MAAGSASRGTRMVVQWLCLAALCMLIEGAWGEETGLVQDDITNPSVRDKWVGKIDDAEKDHTSHHNLVRGYWSNGNGATASASSASSRMTSPGGGKGNHHVEKAKKALPDSKHLSAAQKKKIIAKMKALQKSIMSDFSSNIKEEKRADCSYPYPAASCAGYAPTTS